MFGLVVEDYHKGSQMPGKESVRGLARAQRRGLSTLIPGEEEHTQRPRGGMVKDEPMK